MSEQTNVAPRPSPITLADLEILSSGDSAAGITPRPKKSKKKQTRKDNRFRCQFRFWLDANKPDELTMGKELAALKQRRQYLPTLRDAIRLFLSLLKGETTVLRELFPLIVDQIEYEMIKRDDDRNNDDISSQLAEIRRAIDEQNRKIIPLFDNEGGLVMAGQKTFKQSGNMGQDKAVVAPTFDDDDDGDTLLMKPVEKPQIDMVEGIFAIINNGLQGKNHTAEANAKSLAGRRQQ